MKVLLDTSLLSDPKLGELAEEIGRRRLAGDEFFVSVVTHFQLMWGYVLARRSPQTYFEFLKTTAIEVIPLTKTDADAGAEMKPTRADVLDALIAATARRLRASVWTTDKDFLQFLAHDRVRLVS